MASERLNPTHAAWLAAENRALAANPETGHHRLDAPSAEAGIEARLEWLDDVMFAAIEGDPSSLETAADAWKKLVAELGADILEESRRQYLRRAQTVWDELRHQPNHPPHKVFAAIEVISLLAGKAW